MAAEGKSPNNQFGRELTPTDQGRDEIGSGRVSAGRSRYVDSPDQVVRLEYNLPLDSDPPPQQASGAAEAEAGQIDDADYKGRPDGGSKDVGQAPPGPSMWEAGIGRDD